MADGNYAYPTNNLFTKLLNPIGQENMYDQFVYIPQKICNNTQGQVSVSIISDPINANLL